MWIKFEVGRGRQKQAQKGINRQKQKGKDSRYQQVELGGNRFKWQKLMKKGKNTGKKGKYSQICVEIGGNRHKQVGRCRNS